MNTKKNKQYLETDHKIQNCLLEIINEKQVPTITEICKRCSINRTTFYLHYSDIVELLGKLQEEIFNQFMDSVSKSEQEVTLMSPISYLLFAEHIKENRVFYRLFFKMNTDFPLLKSRFEPTWNNIIKPYYLERGITDEEVMMIRFVAFQAGFSISLKKWVEQDCHLSCDEMAKILCDCISL